MTIRLGELLFERGVLTRDQVEAILEQQQKKARPFGVLAEEMFGVSSDEIEHAWAEQYSRLTPGIDLNDESFDDEAGDVINRRQAWQFRMLPVRFDGRELQMATTVQHLPRALNFVNRRLPMPCAFVIVPPEMLGTWLARRYPMPGMTADAVESDPFASLLKSG